MRLTIALAAAAEELWLNRDVQKQDAAWRVEEKGNEHRLFVGTKPLSFWHDVPLYAEDGIFNFICEIPKGEAAKRKISHTHEFNPIVHSHVDGEAQHYKHATHSGQTGLFLNAGTLPQTWAPAHFKIHAKSSNVHERISEHGASWKHMEGDEEPLDALQVNGRPCKIGEIQRVRVLGAFAVVHDEDGEGHVEEGSQLDWKIIVQDVDDPDRIEGKLDQVLAIGQRHNLLDWYTHHKIADGGTKAQIMGGRSWYPESKATGIIKTMHSMYLDLFKHPDEHKPHQDWHEL